VLTGERIPTTTFSFSEIEGRNVSDHVPILNEKMNAMTHRVDAYLPM
jgi:hypothetical protein